MRTRQRSVVGVFVAELGHDERSISDLSLLGGYAIFEARDAFGVMRSALGWDPRRR